jgi:hypothetical protein
MEHLGLHLSLFKNFTFALFKSAIHRLSFPWEPFSWKANRTWDLKRFNNIIQYR